MNFILFLSDLMVPMIFVIVITNGYLQKVNVYETFIVGAKDGFTTVLQIMPTLIGLMVAVGVLRASGAFEMVSNAIAPITESIGFPTDTVPLIFMRLVSSSASTGMVLDLFQRFGTDTFIGRYVSVMMCATETILYTMSVYFMSIKIEKTGYTLPVALLSNLAAVVGAFFVTLAVFGR